jgi:phosphohistidine phosphatase SixA
MNSGTGRRGAAPAGQGLRDALRWLSETGRHDAAAVEEACRRFDLSPLDEEFLLSEARRARAAADRGGSSPGGTPSP